MKYSVATNWDSQLIDKISQLNKNHKDKVTELYGSLAFSIFGSARSVPGVPEISKIKFENQVRKMKNQNIKLNYLVNSSIFPDLKIKSNHKKAFDYFSWIESLEPEVVTVANKKTLDFVVENFSKIRLNLSIVMGIKSLDKINEFRKKYKNITRITLHQSVNRDHKLLLKHVVNAHNHKSLHRVDVEILANEICFYNCRRMREHYKHLSLLSQKGISSIKPFELWCSNIRRGNPLEFVNAPFIRPEDVSIYKKMNIDILKIAGRGEKTGFLTRSVKAYLGQRYNGNIMMLTYPDCWPRSERPFLDNRKLDGYLEYLWKQNKVKLNRLVEPYNIKY